MKRAAAAAMLAYGGTIFLPEFFHDDQAIIAGNGLLHIGWRGFWGLLTTGYWEAVQGTAATVHYYRPVLMLSYWLQAVTTGLGAPMLHLVNVALHVLAVLLLRAILLRRLAPRAAEAAALFYAVSPMHSEAIAALTGRSEVLVAVFILGAWLCLDAEESDRHRPLGIVLFLLGLLTKETVFLFPLLLALSDWVFHKQVPWQRSRIGLYAALASCGVAVAAVRLAVLPTMVSGGAPYFNSRLIAGLTFSRFSLAHYLLPALTGLAQCSDYSRPLIPDASQGSLSAWLSLACVSAAGTGALWAAVRRRSAAGFWLCGPLLFLLPTCHLILPLDSIGAERFLYLPLIGLSVGVGTLYSRLEKVGWPRTLKAGGLLALSWFIFRSQARNRTYRSREVFYETAVACNPVSSRAWSSLGAALLLKGDLTGGLAGLKRAIELDPFLGTPHYNLARLAFSMGRWDEAERELELALRGAPGDGEAMVLAALVAENRGDLPRMRQYLQRALDAFPGNAQAEYNLGRYWLLVGRPENAAESFRKYLVWAPQDQEIAALIRKLP